MSKSVSICIGYRENKYRAFLIYSVDGEWKEEIDVPDGTVGFYLQDLLQRNNLSLVEKMPEISQYTGYLGAVGYITKIEFEVVEEDEENEEDTSL